MQYSKPAIKVFAIITASMLMTQALAQSGRGRPKVPQPSSTPSQPTPAIKVPAAAAVTNKEQLGATSRFVLRNGITVIISEHHSAPIAAAVARFKAGAVDEPWSMNSVSRLVARMILRGTVLRPGERAVEDLRALGASVETDTSYDGATFSVVAPSDNLRASLGIQADMLQNSVLEAESVRKEIQMLTEEGTTLGTGPGGEFRYHSRAFTTRSLTTEQDDRPSRMFESATYSMARMFNIAFNGAPSLTMDSLRSVTRDQLMEFYRSHYRPDNLIISVAGDVSTFNTLVEIQQLYGDFGVRPPKPTNSKVKAPEVVKPKASAAPTRGAPSDNPTQAGNPAGSEPETPIIVKPWGATEQGKLRYAGDRGDITQSVISVGFHVPGADSKDWPAIEVLTALVGQGRASQLTRSLVDTQMVANRLESDYLAYSGAGLLTVQMWLASTAGEGSALDKAESAFFKELDRLRRETPAEREIARAKTILEKRSVDDSALYLGRARVLARAEAAGMGLRAALDYRARIRSVTAEDVQRVAAKYLTLANTTIHEYEPLTAGTRTFEAESFASTVAAWAPGFGQPVDKAVRAADASSSLDPVPQGSERSPERQAALESVQPLPIRDFSTLNGPKAFVREDHSRPTVTVAILFQGGRLIEDSSTSGTTELMLRSILYGTQRTTYSLVTQELEQLGAEVRIVVEPDFFGFVLNTLSRNADRALKLLRDMIEGPAFRKDDVGRARLGQIAEIRDSRDSGFARSRELLLQTLYDGHPYSLPAHGREEVVAALTGEKLTEWYARAVEKQLPLAIIVGDTDGSALVSSQLAEGFRRRDVDAAIQVRTPRSGAAAERAESRRSEQSTIAIGMNGPRAGSRDLIAVELFESMLNGEGGGLLRELRDKQGLVFTANVSSEAMFVSGLIVAYSTMSPEHEQRAKTALIAEFERLGRAGLSADEMTSARALATTSRIAMVQSQPQHALRYACAIFYKQPAADVDTFGEEIGKVSFEDIKRVGSAIFKTSSVSTAIVRGSRQSPSPPPTAKQN